MKNGTYKNLLFPVGCGSKNCDLVWNTLRQGSKHNPTSQFQHLNITWFNTKHHFALLTLKSFSWFVFCGVHTTLYLSIWGQWLLFCTLILLVYGVVLPHGVVWGKSTLPFPVVLCMRSAQGWDFLLSIQYLSLSPCFSLKAFPKISCTQNTIAGDLCSKQYTHTSLMSTANSISFSTVWCNKDLPLLPLYWTASQVTEKMFIIES